jgi:hypothetical protein
MTSRALLEAVDRIKALALAEAEVLSSKGLSRSERVARKAKAEAYAEVLGALADVERAATTPEACPVCGKQVALRDDGTFRLHRPSTEGGYSWGWERSCRGSRQTPGDGEAA